MRRVNAAVLAAIGMGWSMAAGAQPAAEPATAPQSAAEVAPAAADPAADPAADDGAQGRIVGGRPALAEDAPWQVEIFYSGKLSADAAPVPEWQNRHRCGGAWLGGDWVVTAAHCLYVIAPSSRDRMVFDASYLGSRMVRLGTLRPTQGGEVRRIRFGIMHAGYPGYASPVRTNDIALLKLEPAAFSGKSTMPYAPVPLPPAGYAVPPRQPMLVTGWGRAQPVLSRQARQAGAQEAANAPRLDELKALVVQQLPAEECQRFAQGYGADVSKALCAVAPRDPKGRLQDQCNGDSGGPLTYKFGPKGRARVYLVGLVSWGDGCAQTSRTGAQLPGVFTAVSAHTDWIDAARRWGDAKARSLNGRMVTYSPDEEPGHR